MKHIGMIALIMLTLAGCQSAGDKKPAGVTADAENAKLLEKQQNILIAENRRINEANDNFAKTINELNEQLKQEIEQQQVCVEQTNVAGEIKLTLQQEVLFPSSSYTLSPAGAEVLKKVAAGLKESETQHHLRIVGHSDNRPVSEQWHMQFLDNWDLSARRAAAIARLLIWGYDIKPENISVVGRAYVEPVADNGTEEGRAKNRRIELFVSNP